MQRNTTIPTEMGFIECCRGWHVMQYNKISSSAVVLLHFDTGVQAPLRLEANAPAERRPLMYNTIDSE